MTVGELEHGRGTPMSSREFVEWGVYWKFRSAEQDMALGKHSN